LQQLQTRIRSTTESGSCQFFRDRLLNLPGDEIGPFVEKLDQEAGALRANCLRLSWLMRGGADYETVMNMSFAERTLINKLAEENIETTKKSGLPWF
jgi:hypothetical protein